MGSGVLGLASPWARGAIREPLRSELTALIPDNWTVGVSSDPNRNVFKVWVNDPDGRIAVWEEHSHEPGSLVRAAIGWIHMQEPAEVWTVNSDGTVSTPLDYMRVEA